MDALNTLSINKLKQLAKGLRARIKEKGGDKSTDSEVQKLVKELETVKTVITDKEITEAKEEMMRNQVAEMLKRTKL